MKTTMIYEEYSEDKERRFVVYHNQTRNYYETCIQKKIRDDYMGDYWFDYYDIANDYTHISDTFDRAVEIGKEYLK